MFTAWWLAGESVCSMPVMKLISVIFLTQRVWARQLVMKHTDDPVSTRVLSFFLLPSVLTTTMRVISKVDLEGP